MATEKRQRADNFPMSQLLYLFEVVDNHYEIITSKQTNSITNGKKAAAWQSITDAVNARGPSKRTVDQIKDKWRKSCSKAKLQFNLAKRDTKQTGGGPEVKIDSTYRKILDLNAESPSFVGIGGGEDVGFDSSFDNMSMFEADTRHAEGSSPNVTCTSKPDLEESCNEVATRNAVCTITKPKPKEGCNEVATRNAVCTITRPKPKEGCNEEKKNKHKGETLLKTATQTDIRNIQFECLKAEKTELIVETSKIRAEKRKIEAETIKINLENELLKIQLKKNKREMCLTTEG